MIIVTLQIDLLYGNAVMRKKHLILWKVRKGRHEEMAMGGKIKLGQKERKKDTTTTTKKNFSCTRFSPKKYK